MVLGPSPAAKSLRGPAPSPAPGLGKVGAPGTAFTCAEVRRMQGALAAQGIHPCASLLLRNPGKWC